MMPFKAFKAAGTKGITILNLDKGKSSGVALLPCPTVFFYFEVFVLPPIDTYPPKRGEHYTTPWGELTPVHPFVVPRRITPPTLPMYGHIPQITV